MSYNKAPTEKKIKCDSDEKILYFGHKPQQDMYLTNSPTIPFFKFKYQKHTEFFNKSKNQNKTNINDK